MHSRREFLKKAAYVAPAVLTLDVAMAHASTGSSDSGAAPSSTSSTQESLDRRRHYGWFLGKRVRARRRFFDD